MKFLVRPPKFLRKLYKHSVWRMNPDERSVFLTFDDGPIEDLTPWVLDTLKHYNVKATFFCVGENIANNTALFERIKHEGHQVGNHTYNHLKGWQIPENEYIQNIEKCQAFTKTNLFRPPYGRIKRIQYRKLKHQYKIIFWDVLTHDYDKKISPQTCLANSIKYTRNGSIIVFHDNVKATENLKFTLPKYIEHFLNLKYQFKTL